MNKFSFTYDTDSGDEAARNRNRRVNQQARKSSTANSNTEVPAAQREAFVKLLSEFIRLEPPPSSIWRRYGDACRCESIAANDVQHLRAATQGTTRPFADGSAVVCLCVFLFANLIGINRSRARAVSAKCMHTIPFKVR